VVIVGDAQIALSFHSFCFLAAGLRGMLFRLVSTGGGFMSDPNRRDFLKLSTAALASVAVSSNLAAVANPSAPSGEVQAWSTYGTRRFAREGALRWQPVAGSAADTITLDPSKRFQEILGFGGAFTDAACYMFNSMPAGAREELLREFFSPKAMNFNVCRSCVGSSDYSTRAYTYDDAPQPDTALAGFSAEPDRAYIIPTLAAARKINPDLFLFSSPWSPPGWMKANNSLMGGSMRKSSYGPYADYFVKFLRAYQEAGVKINAVTVQNEVDTDQDGRMPACLWGQEYEIEFIKGYLGPALRNAGMNTKIWALDHNYNLWGRAIGELSDTDAYRFIDGIAWHGYAGVPADMTRVHDAFPEKSCYWTEGGPDISAPDYLTDWTKWSSTYAEILRNWARSIAAWNLVLDEQGKPNIGPFPCGGIVTVDSRSKAVTRSGQYWAFAHYSRMIQRGARVFATAGAAKDLAHVGAENPDGTRVVVLANSGTNRGVQLRLAGSALTVQMPRDAVFTLAWT
jgi:glucosylceramidase